MVPFRHPSQLYEGVGEGLVLGLVLWTLYLTSRRRPWRPGALTAVFLFGYGAIRWSLEMVRQPDEHLGDDVLLGMTMGQTLSVGVMALAAFFFVCSRTRRPAA